VYASPYGEGRYRSDPKTRAFTDTTQRSDPARGLAPKAEGYKAKVGPGSYHSIGNSSSTRSDWARAPLSRGRDEGKEALEVQPEVSFDLNYEDRRGWNWNPVLAEQVQPKLSFAKAKRYNNACMPKPETGPCAVDYYDAVKSQVWLEKSEKVASGSASSFNSVADRWKPKPGEAPDNIGEGPGAYGIPYDPNDSQAYFERHHPASGTGGGVGRHTRLSSSFARPASADVRGARLPPSLRDTPRPQRAQLATPAELWGNGCPHASRRSRLGCGARRRPSTRPARGRRRGRTRVGRGPTGRNRCRICTRYGPDRPSLCAAPPASWRPGARTLSS
jgi:hypothetical protein